MSKCTCALPCGGTEDKCPSSPGYRQPNTADRLRELLVQGLSLMPLGTKVRADWVLAVSNLLGTEIEPRLALESLAYARTKAACSGTAHVCITTPTETALKTFTAFCQHASGTGTVWIDNVQAVDAKQAILLAPQRCAEDWEGVPVEHIRVLGLAEGDVEIVFWEDNT